MDIQNFIKIQNKEYVLAINRKLGDVIPTDLITRQLAAGNDAHSIAQLIVKTKSELLKADNVAEHPNMDLKVSSGFKKFVNWVRRLKNNN
jgi:hypothetical protein